MFAASRLVDQHNAMLQKIESNMKRTERKLAMYFGPLACLEKHIQVQADKGNLLECQIHYLSVAASTGRDADFQALYEDYKASLDGVRAKLIERYRHALLFKETTAEAKPFTEEEREKAVVSYESGLQNLIAPFYLFRLNPYDDVAALLEEKQVEYDKCEAIVDEIYEKKKPLMTAYCEEEQGYVKRREQFFIQSLKATTHPLIQACEQGDLDSVAALIKKKSQEWFSSVKSYINSAHENNFYALHVLIKDYKNDPTCALKGRKWIEIDKKNRAAIAKLLLENGAYPNQETASHYTPLHLAAKHGHNDIVDLLIFYKANVNAVAKGDGYNRTPLHMAAYNGHAAITGLLLLHKANMSAVTNKEDGGKTPLHEAAAMGHLDIVILLVKNGAHVNALTADGYSVLANAECPKMALYLLEHDAHVFKESKYNSMDALLTRAQMRGNKSLIQVLINHAASLFETGLQKCSTTLQKKQKKEIIQAYTEELKARYAVPVRALENDNQGLDILPQAYHNDGISHLDNVDEDIKIEIATWLDYKSRLTMTRVSKFWYAFIHNSLFAQRVGPLLSRDEVNDAKACMNELRYLCDELLREIGDSHWLVIHVKPMANSTNWAVDLYQHDAGKIRTCYLSANTLSIYAQRYRDSLGNAEVFHDVSLD